MKGLEFPIVSTKVKGLNQKFNLNNPAERLKYFEAKCPTEVAKIKAFLSKNTFIAYMVGKKNSGKGTYSKLLMEIPSLSASFLADSSIPTLKPII